MKFNKRRDKMYIVFGAILVLLVFFNQLGWLNPVKSGLRNIFAPIFIKSSGISVKVGEGYEFFKNKDGFFIAYNECRNQIESSAVESSKIYLLQEENDNLRATLNFKEKTKIIPIVSRVVGKNIEQTDQALIIDTGAKDGVAKDMPVIVGDGILIGKIIKVENDMSIVRLINDSQSKIAGAILNTDKSLGVVEGGYGLSVKMNFIPRNENIQVGDAIVTSGLETGITRGLLIGTVTAIENETYRPFQSAVLTPGTDLDKLTLVSVLRTE
ncbi:MAG: rod shape-determining protein MreC [Patescibacteria group bacterium]